jgi:DNA polymerase
MHTTFIDIETRSVTNLRECGAHTYAFHPTTSVLCLAWALDDEAPQLWLPGDPVPAVLQEIPDRLIAHNFSFERAIFEHILVPRHGFPSGLLVPERWHCSQRLALANGYPPELDLLAQALGLPYRKDPLARKAMLAVTRPKVLRKRKPATVPTWDDDPAKLKLLYERCKLDVITARAVWNSSKLQPLSASERYYQLQDIAINERGVRLDRAFAEAARDLAVRERAAVNIRLAELTLGAITSVDQRDRFLKEINARGHNMTALTKRAVAQVLANKPDDYVEELLKLRRTGARAAVNKFKKMLAYASPADDRMRGTLRFWGSATGRWSGLGPQLQNMKKNESGLPLTVVDDIRAGNRAEIARYGNPLSLLGDLSRAALCASPGNELKSGDFSAIESVVLAWLAGETWKLVAYKTFWETGDVQREPYRVIARRMLQRPEDAEIDSAERQLGKAGELASGFGGGVGAWRRIVPHDPRTDDEIKAIIRQWRNAHGATRKFWTDLARAARVAIRTGQSILVAPPPQPPIVADYENGNLRLTLPSGRAITYPEARLIPAKFEDAPPDIEFKDNARGQWKPYRAWFGTLVENVVQGVARDLLAAAIERFETCGIPVVFHCHDEVTAEVPVGSLSDQEFLDILLKPPRWAAAGLPLGGKVHSGPHYLEAPEHPAEPLVAPAPEDTVLGQAVDAYVGEVRDSVEPEDDPVAAERADERDCVAELSDHEAPLTDLVTLPLSADNKVACPFHEDAVPSLQVYPDHYHCFSCGAHGGRLDWLVRIEGLTEAEAIAYIRDWPGPSSATPQNGHRDEAEKLAFVKSIWTPATPLFGSIAERYLDETRDIDLSRLPADIDQALRFHPACVFGPGATQPCLIALMRDPLTDAPVGIQRIALHERDGRIEKLERRMLGRAGVIKLWPIGPALVVGEGLETTLAAATRVVHRGEFLQPAWAAMSSDALGKLPVLPGVERLIVLVDHDPTGKAAAEICCERWTRAGRAVVCLTPTHQGNDFNDLVWKGAA